ncbi:family 115 putative glycoside hydrolase [Podospora australis]|uniref:Family 115 putative glycoside hydrolase n=1 Tax=Podospora australis TaxID=1536484 RepID=A0AAN7APN8_9PEZI|nr:family 115 putative glycoside hydrolase [Podospora australis]
MAREVTVGTMAPLFGLVTLALSLVTPGLAYTQQPSVFTFAASGPGFQLGGPGLAPEIRVAPNDLPGVKRVANDLAIDFGRVLGVNGTVVVADWSSTTAQKTSSRPIILVGTMGQSSLIDNLSSSKKIDTAAVANKWETYTYQVVQSPWDGKDSVFVIAGSDLRGTVFGVYDVSEHIGVSPWHYWADVPATKRQYIWANSVTRTEGPPSIKFRGIFLNDESPGLTGWGRTKFKVSQYGSPFVTEFYQLIFELVLRLRGNYVWPAMWSSMFYLDDPRNGPTATEWGIFMGTSHHEPMARADKEQGRFLKGSWDWRSNKGGVQAFMEEGVTRSKNWSTIYTLGMRGSGDAASATLTSAALEEAISWQQGVLTRVTGKPLSEIPQAWVMYKEVPGYWQKGMKVSDDVTLLWSDDNRGNIRRIPIGNEPNRRGGSGMYYHFDYVGDPRNYKWINTIQLQKTWEQMTLAHDSGIQNIWIANVGDLKGLELPTAHFMALAWDRKAFSDFGSTKEWLKVWSARQWGKAAGDVTASIMTRYGKLTSRMKYEDLSRTPFAFNTANYDEAELNFNEWTALLKNAQAVHDSLPKDVQTSFWEVVLHPIVAGRGVYEIYTKTAMGSMYQSQHRVSANQLARDVQTAFAADSAITKQYHSILNGKWNNVMAQTHIGYNNWQEPASHSLPKLSWLTTAAKNALMGVAAQGGTAAFPGTARLTLPAISPWIAPSDQRWLEVFSRDNGTFTYRITSNASFVSVTNAEQTLSTPATTQIRSVISVDWASAPAGVSTVGLTVTNLNATGTTATVILPVQNNKVPADFKGHVEANSVVSIEAEHYSSASSSEYIVIPDYGRTLSGVKLPPKTPSQPAGKGHVLVYPFYTFTDVSAASLTVYLSPSENANPNSPNKYTFTVDGGSQTTVQPVPLNDGSSQPAGWSEAVIQGSYVRKSNIGRIAAGKHELKVYLHEPTMVLTKLVIDLGGLKPSMMGPPESARV